MTVNNIVVSMKGKIMPGQAYVALSRVKNLDGLHIKEFDEKKIIANEKVKTHMEYMRKNNTFKFNMNFGIECCFSIAISH